MAHGLACDDPRFRQSLPKRPDELTLLTPSKFAGSLLYRDEASGEEYLVPSIGYNQPVAWRIDYAEFCAERSRENAERMRRAPLSFSKLDAEAMERQAQRLQDAAERMRHTGIAEF